MGTTIEQSDNARARGVTEGYGKALLHLTHTTRDRDVRSGKKYCSWLLFSVFSSTTSNPPYMYVYNPA